MIAKTYLALGVALVLALPSAARADTTEQDLAKYKRLRQRLLSDFTSVGSAPGQSQPAPERDDVHGTMHWGDGTIALGFYLGVLATEIYMLAHPATFPGADNGDATQLGKTLDELYHALLAMERLDLVADAAFPAPCTAAPALNGFFVRDDVPLDFYTHFPGITQTTSDFTDPTLTNKEESQDQVYHVQHGLALVVALVPDSYVAQGKALRPWAMEQAQRIAAHFATGDWNIRNPACGDRVVNRGGNAIGYSYGETLAASFLTAGAFVPTTDPTWQSIWDTLRAPNNPAYGNENNLHMALAIMAVGDGYAADTGQVMATLSDLQDWPLYPLLHRVLHGSAAVGFCSTASTVNGRARLMLDELPANGEPACPGAAGPAPHGWTSHNRFIRGKSQAYVGPAGCESIRYHGLDYMLLHNLYAIATPGTWKGDGGADPCAGDGGVDPGLDLSTGMPAADAAVGSGDGGGAPPPKPGAGCDCQLATSARAPHALLLLLVGVALARRARRRYGA